MVALDARLIQAICELGQKYEARKIVLFGSRAKGSHRPNSDIDLAVYSIPGVTKEGSLAGELDDLDTLLKIDVVFITEKTDRKLQDAVQKEGVVLYDRLSE
ncbi:MAG: nucleotidyltransferase domain-containing protein [Clostridia bacterium]|nr:nucleotidyltransferase domain-containing protein [Clostridia bacterium]